ncbi:RNA polymerase sigma factor [Bacillus anthracis str. UR-1]|nr:RNA polymerase sigma factor [Bacillus anthracis str. UR-1]
MKRKQSLEEIYSEHMQDLFRYLLSLTGDSHFAEDLMQETFYRMLVHIDYYKGEEIRPWLFTIATTPLSIGIEKKKDIKRRQLQNSIYQTCQVQSTLIS